MANGQWSMVNGQLQTVRALSIGRKSQGDSNEIVCLFNLWKAGGV